MATVSSVLRRKLKISLQKLTGRFGHLLLTISEFVLPSPPVSFWLLEDFLKALREHRANKAGLPATSFLEEIAINLFLFLGVPHSKLFSSDAQVLNFLMYTKKFSLKALNHLCLSL